MTENSAETAKSEEREVEEKEKERARKVSIYEGSAYAVNEGFGSRYITPYALALGATNAHIGFLASIPTLLGNFSQLFTSKIMEKISRKKISFYSALFQALMWLPVLFLGVMFFIFGINSTITPTLLILIYALLVMFGVFYGPAWSSWMKDIATEKRGKYFGKRNRIVGFVALISMLAGGFVLDYFKQTKIFLGFVILFGIACVARIISASLFLKKYEPAINYEKGYYFSFRQFLKKMPKSNFGRFVIFIALIHLVTAIASPFFTVYMLKELQFSYVEWIAVMMSASLVSLLSMPIWGKFADNYGTLKAVKICSFLIFLVPLLWLASPFIASHSTLLIYLLVIEAFSGLVWAGFNLASSNFIYDAVTRQRMALCVAYFNILVGVGVFFGATFGGFLSTILPNIFGFSPLLLLFLISGVARFIVALIMSPKIKEVREVKKFGIKEAKEIFSTMTPGRLWTHLEISIKPRKIT